MLVILLLVRLCLLFTTALCLHRSAGINLERNFFNLLGSGYTPPSNCTVADPTRVGDGWCDYLDYNTAACDWDGGDCCESTCVSRKETCGSNGYFECQDSQTFSPTFAPSAPTLPPASHLTLQPTVNVSPVRTQVPTFQSASPTFSPTVSSLKPTINRDSTRPPTSSQPPTFSPSLSPALTFTSQPTISLDATKSPTDAPRTLPTNSPSLNPAFSRKPTISQGALTQAPSISPTTTSAPLSSPPTCLPSSVPDDATSKPTISLITTPSPSLAPSPNPSPDPPTLAPSSSPSIVPSASPSIVPSPQPIPTSIPTLRPTAQNSPATVVSFTSTQALQGLASADFDPAAQDAFEFSVAATLLNGGYDSSVAFLSVTAAVSSSSLSAPHLSAKVPSTRGPAMSLAGRKSSISILFEIAAVLEKTPFDTPSSLVSSLQQYLSASLVTPAFASRFLEKCVELGAQSINETTEIVFGNVSSSPDFTVLLVETSSPTAVPATSIARGGGSGGSGASLPVWAFVLLGIGVLLVLGLMVTCRRKRSSVSALPVTRFIEIARSTRNYDLVPTHSVVYLEDIHLNPSADPEGGDLLTFPGSQPL